MYLCIMKKTLRHISMTLIILLCGSAISLCSGMPARADASLHHHSTASGIHYLDAPTSDWLCHTPEHKSFNGTEERAVSHLLRNNYQETILAQKHTAQLAHSELARYTFYSKYLIRRLEKPDIIYPFHAFW